MATPEDIARHREAREQVIEWARADLASLLDTIDWSDPDLAAQILLEMVPEIAQRHGVLVADIAAEWYDELRASAGVRGRYRARPAGPFDPNAIDGTVRRLIYSDTAGDIGALLAMHMTKWVMQPGRDTISDNAGRDRAKWARVPLGPEPCAFCLMLASRGFAYTSEHKAGKKRDGTKYHGDCSCEPVVDWSDDPRLEGYDPDALYDAYEQAANAVGNRHDTSAILSEQRARQGAR